MSCRYRYRFVALAAGLLTLGASAAPAGAAITYVAQSSAASTTATMSIARPSNLAANDVLVATVSGAGTGAITAPAGWTAIEDTITASNGMRVISFVRVAGASESSAYAFTSPAARNATGGIVALRGVNRVVPVDAVAEATGASGAAAAPSVTTSSAGGWVVTAAAVNRNTTFTPPSGNTERYDRAGTSTSSSGSTFTQAAAGATPAKTATPANTSAGWVAHTIALRDSATAGLTLSVGAASASFTSDLDAGDSTNPWTVPVTIADTRMTAPSAGWQMQITSTAFTTGARSLAATASDLTGVSGVTCGGRAPCDLPVNSVAVPVALPAGPTAPTAVKGYNAASGSGEGRIDLTAEFATTVPQNAFAGTYNATVTVSVVSGP